MVNMQNARARELREKITSLDQQLKAAERELEGIEKRCKHDWTEPKYKPDYHPTYTDPGDPPGTMGVDRRLPTFVPARTVDRWFRTCKLCGKPQETTRTKVVEVKHEPVF